MGLDDDTHDRTHPLKADSRCLGKKKKRKGSILPLQDDVQVNSPDGILIQDGNRADGPVVLS